MWKEQIALHLHVKNSVQLHQAEAWMIFLTFFGFLDFFLLSSLILFFFGPIMIMFSLLYVVCCWMNEKNSVKKKHLKIMMQHSNLFHRLKMSSVVYTDEILILLKQFFQFVYHFVVRVKMMKRKENPIY